MTIKPYTVILLRPRALAEVNLEMCGSRLGYGKDIYAAQVHANGLQAAIEAAQMQAYDVDAQEDWPVRFNKVVTSSAEYEMVVIFDGHPNPILFCQG